MSDKVHSPWDALDTIGNIAAWVRENCGDATNQTQKYMDDIIMFVNAALALPRRNCDMGTAEEQDKRFDAFCKSYKEHHGNCFGCAALRTSGDCKVSWMRMPYEEKGSEG